MNKSILYKLLLSCHFVNITFTSSVSLSASYLTDISQSGLYITVHYQSFLMIITFFLGIYLFHIIFNF